MFFFQHSEEIYDPEIYRHQISEYYNSYVLDQDIQTGESNLCIVSFSRGNLFKSHPAPLL